MRRATLVAGDWGTSRLRLFLCDAEGAVLDSVEGPGASAARAGFAEIFDSLAERWTAQHGALPAVLCGMVGSSFGWKQAPYLECPARPEQIAASCIELREGRIRIVPGLACRNPLGAPDVLRGEETQILGALHLDPTLRRGRHLLCLPGTHTKWTLLEDGSVQQFITAATGEVFALLRAHSVLVSDSPPRADAEIIASAPAFTRGLSEQQRAPNASLLLRLFEARSRRLRGELAEADAPAYLSGLMVGSDVSGALSSFRAISTVQVIGSPQVANLYAAALESQGRQARTVDGAAAALAGLVHVHRLSSGPGALHGT